MSFHGEYARCKVIKTYHPQKRKIHSLNEMQQTSGHFIIYKRVLDIKYGDWGSLQFRYGGIFLKYF